MSMKQLRTAQCPPFPIPELIEFGTIVYWDIGNLRQRHCGPFYAHREVSRRLNGGGSAFASTIQQTSPEAKIKLHNASTGACQCLRQVWFGIARVASVLIHPDESRAVCFFCLFFRLQTHMDIFFSPGLFRVCLRLDSKCTVSL